MKAAGRIKVAPIEERRPGDWSNEPDLALLGTGRRPAPPFPLDLLGPFWADWVRGAAKGASAPIDYVGVTLLAAVGAILANVRCPLAGARWSEPTVLWIGIVGSPSSGKSPGMDAVLDVLRHAEERMAVGYDEIRRGAEMEREVAEMKHDMWKAEMKAAVKSGKPLPTKPEGAEPLDLPQRPRVRVADATTEALGALAASLPRGLLMVRDELAGWLGSFDRYGGGGADRAFAIEMYGGRSYTIDRKTAEPLRIDNLSIGVVGGVQPDRVRVITGGVDDGLASRFLWAWPDGSPDFRLARTVPDDARARVAFARLADLCMGTNEFGALEPTRVPLTTEAEEVIEGFAQDIQASSHAEYGPMAGALGKARGHALRLSLIIEFLWWSQAVGAPEPVAVSADAAKSAVGLVHGYFLKMARRVYGDASLPPAEQAAITVIGYLRAHRITAFNCRDLRRNLGGPVRESRAMQAACGVLSEAGLIRESSPKPSSRYGRRALNYEVHPAVHGASL